jgi:hypothetical protein
MTNSLFFSLIIHHPPKEKETREENKRAQEKLCGSATSTYVHQVSDAQPAL